MVVKFFLEFQLLSFKLKIDIKHNLIKINYHFAILPLEAILII